MRLFCLIWILSLANLASSYDAVVTFGQYAKLEVTFTDQDDTVSLRVDPQGYVTLVEGDLDPELIGSRLLSNVGYVPAIAIQVAVVHLGDGDDQYGNPTFVPLEAFVIYGGIGNDNIKIATGITAAYAFGGPGNDIIKGEHNATNFFYGGPGNDSLFGGSDGFNVLDGGAGENSLWGFRQTIGLFPKNLPTVYVHSVGSFDTFKDFTGSGTYLIKDTPGTAVGTLHIKESGSGMDVLVTNGVPLEVVGGKIISPRITGRFDNFETIEVVSP